MASEHLRLMQRCGFLSCEKEGRNAYYRVSEPHLKDIMACVVLKPGVACEAGELDAHCLHATNVAMTNGLLDLDQCYGAWVDVLRTGLRDARAYTLAVPASLPFAEMPAAVYDALAAAGVLEPAMAALLPELPVAGTGFRYFAGKPPPRLTIDSVMPCVASRSKIALASPTASSQAKAR